MIRFVPLTALAALLSLPLAADAASILLGTTGQFQVLNKGAVDPSAKLYRSLTPPWQFLVDTPVFPRPVLITTGPTGARLVERSRITADPADPEHVHLDTGGSMDDVLSVSFDGPNLVVDRNGLTIALAPSPPILGDRTLDQIAGALPEYRRNAAAYTPDKAAVEKLKHLEQPTELLVFFGSWCSHCEQFVPRLVRVLQDAKSPQLHVTFHGVPPGGERDQLADDMQITGLPTGILKRDGKELSRMVEEAWDAPETSLAAALSAKPSK